MKEVKYKKTINYEFEINNQKIELSIDDIILLQEAFKNIINNNKETKIVFID